MAVQFLTQHCMKRAPLSDITCHIVDCLWMEVNNVINYGQLNTSDDDRMLEFDVSAVFEHANSLP